MNRTRILVLIAAWTALAGCNEPCEVQLCDIREPACQRAVARATACTRGVPETDVPITVVRKEDFIAAEVALANNRCAAQKQAFADQNAGLALLRLAPESYDIGKAAADDAGWVGAYYRSDARTITIIDDGEPMDSPDLVFTLVHEYAHALQGVAGVFEDYGARAASGFDGQLGASAIVEGEAVLVEDLAVIDWFDVNRDDIPWVEVFQRWQDWSLSEASRQTAPVLLARLSFLYSFGGDLVNRAHAQGGFAAVEALHLMPPRGARDVLAALAARSATVTPMREELGDTAVPLWPEEYTIVAHETYGVWVLERFMGRLLPLHDQSLDMSRSLELSRKLRGDRLSIHRGPAGQIVTTWRLRFADARSAATLVELVGLNAPSWQTWQIDRDVVIVATKATGVRIDTAVSFGPAPTVPPVTCGAMVTTAPHPFRCARRPSTISSILTSSHPTRTAEARAPAGQR